MRPLFLMLFSLIFLGCDTPKSYSLLYPIEASKQKVLRLEGYRFLSSERDLPASILVLSNPVEEGGFADFAFSMSNTGNTEITLTANNFEVKLAKKGRLPLLSSEAYSRDRAYQKPEGFEKLAPKMQTFGCAAANTKDNIKATDFDQTQAWVWQKHLAYPFKETKFYTDRLSIAPHETAGRVFRIALPRLNEDQTQANMMIKVIYEGKTLYRFSFILQSLNG